MRVILEEIVIFVVVVESGSFSWVVEQFGQVNFVVSWVVKKLELKLGVSLFNWIICQFSLIEEGECYFCCMQVVLQEMVVVENDLLEMCMMLWGLLWVDVVMLVMLYFFMLLVKLFCECYLEMMLLFVLFEMFINLIEWKVDVVIWVGILMDFSLCV